MSRGLQNNEINIMLSHIPEFKGAFTIDFFRNILEAKPGESVIINHDKGLSLKELREIDKGNIKIKEKDLPGTHWVAMHIPEKGNIEYFDPLGMPPNETILKYTEKLRKEGRTITYSNYIIQPDESTLNPGEVSNTCGHFCVLFILQKNLGMDFLDFLHQFNLTNPTENEEILARKLFEYYQGIHI